MPTTEDSSVHHLAENQGVATNPGPEAPLLHVNHWCPFLLTILTFGLLEFHALRATRVSGATSTIGKYTYHISCLNFPNVI